MKYDLAIVGGGIVGLYTAYRLAQCGLNLTVIDKGEFGMQCSWAAGGILTPLLPWDYTDNVHFLTTPAVYEYQLLSQKLIEANSHNIEFWQCGMRVLSPDLASAQAWCKRYNMEYTSVDHGDTYIQLKDVAQVRTPRLIKALLAQLKYLGVRLLANTTVNHCRISHDRVVGIDTSAGHIVTPKVIWTKGAWSSNLNSQERPLHSPKITPIKGQMIAIQGFSGDLCQIVYKRGHYLIPRQDGLILAGSTLEDSGFNNTTTQTAKEGLFQRCVEIMPELANAIIVAQWAGLRPGSNNNTPTIGPHTEIEGLFLNTGHYRYGIAMAPKSANIIEKWICDNGQSLTQQERVYQQIT